MVKQKDTVLRSNYVYVAVVESNVKESEPITVYWTLEYWSVTDNRHKEKSNNVLPESGIESRNSNLTVVQPLNQWRSQYFFSKKKNTA